MTLADLIALDVCTLWAGLKPEQQAEIGSAALAQQFAQLVFEDNGTNTTKEDRSIAMHMASEAYDGIAKATEQAFPQIQWWET